MLLDTISLALPQTSTCLIIPYVFQSVDSVHVVNLAGAMCVAAGRNSTAAAEGELPPSSSRDDSRRTVRERSDSEPLSFPKGGLPKGGLSTLEVFAIVHSWTTDAPEAWAGYPKVVATVDSASNWYEGDPARTQAPVCHIFFFRQQICTFRHCFPLLLPPPPSILATAATTPSIFATELQRYN
jgi:hypothetical protein